MNEKAKELGKADERYFIWNDGDGHNYCVPTSLENEIDKLDNLHPVHNCNSEEEFYEKWDEIFNEIEPKLIRFEGVLTFTNPKTE